MDPQLAPQNPTAAAIVGNGDDGSDVAAVALQATQEGGQAGAAADGHNAGPAAESPLGHQGIHQVGVLFRGQGLLDRAKAAALAQPDQPSAQDQDEGAGDAAGQHLGDPGQTPANRLQGPVNGLQISPDRCAQQGNQQPQPGSEHPALHHQAWLQPAHGPP